MKKKQPKKMFQKYELINLEHPTMQATVLRRALTMIEKGDMTEAKQLLKDHVEHIEQAEGTGEPTPDPMTERAIKALMSNNIHDVQGALRSGHKMVLILAFDGDPESIQHIIQLMEKKERKNQWEDSFGP